MTKESKMQIDKITINSKTDLTIDIVIEWPLAKGLRFFVAKALLKLAASIMPVGCRIGIANGQS